MTRIGPATVRNASARMGQISLVFPRTWSAQPRGRRRAWRRKAGRTDRLPPEAGPPPRRGRARAAAAQWVLGVGRCTDARGLRIIRDRYDGAVALRRLRRREPSQFTPGEHPGAVN